MVDLIYRDYAAWKIESHEIINQFKDNDNVIYQRLESVIIVLDHIYDFVCEGIEIDEDYNTIFEVGFNYLHSQFEVIKVYFESLFKKNCDDFINYSHAVLYLLFIYDIRTDIENHDIDVNLENLDIVEADIENLIMDRSDDFLVVEARLKETLDNLYESMGYEYQSIIDIFEDIAVTLGIRYIEQEDLVIGKDI